MNAVFILALLLLFLMIIFGGKKGFISYLTLFLNFAILIISIVLIIFGVPIYVVTFFFCIIIGACNLFVLNSYNVKTQAAFISTIVTTILLITLIIYRSTSVIYKAFQPNNKMKHMCIQ
ncbi:yibE/F-like family protein [Staphylococcus aureus]|uniref:YibE/F-like family protein n=1 Tax=Staphylococcus aureus TaxID=1280 RepID=A0A380EFB6_STAAU|nr:yibE/F-like family protein [Staphylococcus aureus]